MTQILDSGNDSHVRRLRDARESPDLHVRTAADALVLNMALGLGGKAKEATGTKIEKSPEEKEIAEARAARLELESFLEGAKKEGWEAWPEVKRKIQAYVERYPLYMTTFKDRRVGMMYMADDASWHVSVTGDAKSAAYEIQKLAYRTAEAA